MKSKEIKDVSDYIKEISKIYKNKSFVPDKKKDGLFFRGHSKCEYKLLPKVFRNKRNKRNEKKILLNYRDNLPRMTSLNLDFINNRLEILVEMQHYELPTRLLDWTLSPLVALYFAVNNRKVQQDAVVWVFNPWAYQEKLRPSNASTNWFEMSKFARAMLSDRKFCDIKDILKVKYYGDISLTEDDISYPFPLIAQYQNPRIIHQSGAFTIHGSCENAFEVGISKDCLVKIIIPLEHRKCILEELRLLYFNDFTVFPDYKGMKSEFDGHGSLYHVR